jgi:hypothetical protein
MELSLDNMQWDSTFDMNCSRMKALINHGVNLDLCVEDFELSVDNM